MFKSIGNLIILDVDKRSFNLLLFPIKFRRKDKSETYLHFLEIRISFLKGLRYISWELFYFISGEIRFYI